MRQRWGARLFFFCCCPLGSSTSENGTASECTAACLGRRWSQYTTFCHGLYNFFYELRNLGVRRPERWGRLRGTPAGLPSQTSHIGFGSEPLRPVVPGSQLYAGSRITKAVGTGFDPATSRSFATRAPRFHVEEPDNHDIGLSLAEPFLTSRRPLQRLRRDNSMRLQIDPGSSSATTTHRGPTAPKSRWGAGREQPSANRMTSGSNGVW